MNKPILIATAVAQEQEAVLSGLPNPHPFEVVTVGVGSMAAAANTSALLAQNQYELVINMGIAGGFAGQAALASLVVATDMVALELGAETESGFCFIDELGFGSACICCDQKLVKQVTTGLEATGYPITTGSVLTVSTVTGTAATASARAKRVSGAAAEAMEGFGVACAAQTFGLPALEIRAISNVVGPRDRAAWQMNEALEALTVASNRLVGVFQS